LLFNEIEKENKERKKINEYLLITMIPRTTTDLPG